MPEEQRAGVHDYFYRLTGKFLVWGEFADVPIALPPEGIRVLALCLAESLFFPHGPSAGGGWLSRWTPDPMRVSASLADSMTSVTVGSRGLSDRDFDAVAKLWDRALRGEFPTWNVPVSYVAAARAASAAWHRFDSCLRAALPEGLKSSPVAGEAPRL